MNIQVNNNQANNGQGNNDNQLVPAIKVKIGPSTVLQPETKSIHINYANTRICVISDTSIESFVPTGAKIKTHFPLKIKSCDNIDKNLVETVTVPHSMEFCVLPDGLPTHSPKSFCARTIYGSGSKIILPLGTLLSLGNLELEVKNDSEVELSFDINNVDNNQNNHHNQQISATAIKIGINTILLQEPKSIHVKNDTKRLCIIDSTIDSFVPANATIKMNSLEIKTSQGITSSSMRKIVIPENQEYCKIPNSTILYTSKPMNAKIISEPFSKVILPIGTRVMLDDIELEVKNEVEVELIIR